MTNNNELWLHIQIHVPRIQIQYRVYKRISSPPEDEDAPIHRQLSSRQGYSQTFPRSVSFSQTWKQKIWPCRDRNFSVAAHVSLRRTLAVQVDDSSRETDRHTTHSSKDTTYMVNYVRTLTSSPRAAGFPRDCCYRSQWCSSATTVDSAFPSRSRQQPSARAVALSIRQSHLQERRPQ